MTTAAASPSPIRFGADPGPEDLVNHDSFALLVAMLLDQQVPITWAFVGPSRLSERLDGRFDPETIGTMATDRFEAVAATKPAIHRYHRSMARRIQEMSRAISHDYDGRADAIWIGERDGREVRRRLEALPGFGAEKAQITVAVLAKRFGIQFDHLHEAAGPFADDQPRSVADIDGPEGLEAVKAWKKSQREAGRAKDDPVAS